MKRAIACPECGSHYFDKELVTCLSEVWVYRWECVNCSYTSKPFKARQNGTQITPVQNRKLDKIKRYLNDDGRKSLEIKTELRASGWLCFDVTIDKEFFWLQTRVSGYITRKGKVTVSVYSRIGSSKEFEADMIGYLENAVKR